MKDWKRSSLLAIGTVFAGVLIGIFLRYFDGEATPATENNPQLIHFASLRTLLIEDDKYPRVDIGDAFPLAYLKFEQKSENTLDIASGKWLLFLTFDSCSDCQLIRSDWDALRSDAIQRGISMLIVSDSTYSPRSLESIAGQYPGAVVGWADFRRLRRELNICFIPTIFSLREGEITHMQFGYEEELDSLHFMD